MDIEWWHIGIALICVALVLWFALYLAPLGFQETAVHDFRMHAIDINPGDTLVVKFQGPVSIEVAERISERIRSEFGDVKVFVLGDNATIDVLRMKKPSA